MCIRDSLPLLLLLSRFLPLIRSPTSWEKSAALPTCGNASPALGLSPASQSTGSARCATRPA
eukprot:8047644-Alexandrium_andersonii.AAC.1